MLLELEDRAKVSATTLSNIMAEEDEMEGKLSEWSKSVKMAEASFIQSLDENNCISQERDGLIRKLEVMSCEKQSFMNKIDEVTSKLKKAQGDNCYLAAAKEEY